MSSVQNQATAKEDDYGTKFLENLAWVAVGAAAVVVAFFAWNFARQGVSTDPAEWGQFGDYVGGLLNPTFSLIALLVLIKTMRLQVKELNQAHQEMKNSADALKAQQETMELQRFETTFFNLINQTRSDVKIFDDFSKWSPMYQVLTVDIVSSNKKNNKSHTKEILTKFFNSKTEEHQNEGVSVEFLMKKFYPSLRRVIYLIDYINNGFIDMPNCLAHRKLYLQMGINFIPSQIINTLFVLYLEGNWIANSQAFPMSQHIIIISNKYGLFSSIEFDYHPIYFPLVDEAAWGDSLEEKRAAYLAYLQEQGINPNETHT